jgi:hypothetical protein
VNRYERGWVDILGRIRRQCLVVVAVEGLALIALAVGMVVR